MRSYERYLGQGEVNGELRRHSLLAFFLMVAAGSSACDENPGAWSVPLGFSPATPDAGDPIPPEAPPVDGGTPYIQGPGAVGLDWNSSEYMDKDRAVVQIRRSGGARCSGTLIHRYFVLTAAHCFWRRNPETSEVEDFRNVQAEGMFIRVWTGHETAPFIEIPLELSFLHPGYGLDSLDHDIAIAMLSHRADMDGDLWIP